MARYEYSFWARKTSQRVALAIRGYEFANLNVRWDANAYGSILWVILGLHTTHLATDARLSERHESPMRGS